jgi:hypothetical protein
MSAQDRSPKTGTRHRLIRLLGVGAMLGLGGCVTWPGYGPSWESSSYYGRSYDAYGGVYEKRYGYPYDDGLRYGRPFYTTYGAYPPGFYYDPRFLGHGRPVRPPAPPAAPPPPAPDPVATPPAQPPRIGPRPRPNQPGFPPVPRADPVARPAPPPPPQRYQPPRRIP